ncbi:alpha/beta hydrolase [Actinacidiphila guanduensis]|uniref:Pimeloyl-ACP methyl ester carboxylesterase n=1 Tax=Actinacidiphila guanduensis TaxID=310781 RepID=A0A1H0ME10_9ACTN|nr:alpha/beta hydrolase [Actinacidiphila guanduensis]SDO78430.1 Pimeloyl-ACP methyl ester carboxylesterase [Actinacidiphila guanduensis]
MKRMRRLGFVLLTTAAALTLTLSSASPSNSLPAGGPSSGQTPTIVLVHGAWADASSWAAVTERLQKRGFTVKAPPNTLRGVATDSANLRAYLQTIKGPVVLAGHSYGGFVVTNAATGLSNVKSLVFIDAFIPDTGETVNQLTTAEPGSLLAVPDPNTVFDFVPIPNSNGDADAYIKSNLYRKILAADVPRNKTDVLAAGQRPIAASTLNEPSGQPAWKTIPSWALIGTADKAIPPAEQRNMTARAGSHVVSVRAPHLSMVSNPDAVTNVIISAVQHS